MNFSQELEVWARAGLFALEDRAERIAGQDAKILKQI